MDEKIKCYHELFDKMIIKKVYINDLKGFLLFMLDYTNLLYETVHNYEIDHLDNEENEINIRKTCSFVSDKVYKKFNLVRSEYINKKSKEKDILDLFNRIEDDLYSIMAMRSLKHFAYYMDRDKIKIDRVWENGTMDIFENVFYYVNQMILKDNIDMIRASFFPGAGKSYAGNLLTAYWLGYNPTMSFLRITYNDELTKSFVRQTANIIKNKRFKKVFKQFDMADKDLFQIDNSNSFQLCFSQGLNLVGTTCLGKGTGFRAKVLMLDDVVKGVQDAYNIEMQKKIVNMYDNEWTSRADNGNQKIIALGTMWSCYDILNVIQKRALKNGVYMHPKFKYTLCDSNVLEKIRKVFISTPALDYDTDKSTCPKRYSTDYFRRKREDSEDKDMFEAVYQQNPQEPEELLFAYSRLKTYRELPKEYSSIQCMAMIDPVREGQNFFAMPILKRFNIKGEWTKWYLVDCIYKFETNEKCQPHVVEKIVRHKIEWLGYEKNVDASWIKLVKQDLAKNEYTKISVKNIYTVKNKQNKISMARDGILNDIIYPAQGMFSPKSEMGLGMIHLTTWTFFGRNAYDDFPDAMAMFVQENPTKKKSNGNSFQVIPRIY